MPTRRGPTLLLAKAKAIELCDRTLRRRGTYLDSAPSRPKPRGL